MKKYILRAPETDRKGVSVPNLLTDLDDYNDTICIASIEANTEQAATYTVLLNVVFDTTIELVNASLHTEGATVGNAGLFVISYSVFWQNSASGPYLGPVTDPTLRVVGVFVNGVLRATATNSSVPNGIDAGTTVTRLAASDYVEVKALNSDPASPGRIALATLQISKIAP